MIELRDVEHGVDIFADGLRIGIIRRAADNKCRVQIGTFDRTYDGMDYARDKAEAAAAVRRGSARMLTKVADAQAAEFTPPAKRGRPAASE